jgi:hypothetical protein
MLIEDMCRKSAYIGSGQSKVFVKGWRGFICGKFKPNIHPSMR